MMNVAPDPKVLRETEESFKTLPYAVSQSILSMAFDAVKPANWKDPIDKVLVVHRSQWASEVIHMAVVHFTGSVPMFYLERETPEGNLHVRVTAIGYYAAIGA